jgi:tetratricopeptide (TPR) repeat protein
MKRLTGLLLLAVFMASCAEEKTKQGAVVMPSPVMCAPVTSDKEWYESDNKAPLFEGLGSLHFPITTSNALAQTYFNQGLVLAYGFNHAEAARSFYYATKLDPDCAMAQWGYAYALGPNYNAGMEADNYERAYVAIQSAIEIAENKGTEKERELIAALAKRYVEKPVDDRYQLDVDYANAMEKVYNNYKDDADIGTLYAESLMNLHKWDLYDQLGKAKAWTPQILSILESVFEVNPRHCGANHFYIHVVESSDNPAAGLRSAELFDEGLVPNAGHLVHMSSHIYIRTGDYHKGTIANINAIKVDSNYVASCNAQGAYPLAYFPHNQHFMAGTATLEGNSKWALYAADAVAENANRQLMKAPGWGTIQHYYTIPFYVYVKFGKWDEILQMSNEVPELIYPQAILHYAKGMALLSKGEVDNAKDELAALAKIASNDALKEVTIWDINSVFELVTIAEKILKAEILATEQKFEESLALLEHAVEIEDELNYNEPPDWFFSVRHHLGAVQIESKDYIAAIRTFEKDLARLPKNGWALHGIRLAYSALNDKDIVAEINDRLEEAW